MVLQHESTTEQLKVAPPSHDKPKQNDELQWRVCEKKPVSRMRTTPRTIPPHVFYGHDSRG